MSTPFDNFSFDGNIEAPAADVSNDDVIRVLSQFNPPSVVNTPVFREPTKNGGIERVNANSKNTGAFAYKDDKGQTVLTNVASNASGKQTPIGHENQQKQEQQSQSVEEKVTTPNNPLAIFAALGQLKKTSSPEEARALHSSLQEAIAVSKADHVKRAMDFAEQKLQIPQLQAELDKARQADRADPKYLPGMGDSPITQKIVAQLLDLRRMADNEAKMFLGSNGSYLSLQAAEKTADLEYQRVEKFADRKEMLELQRRMSTEESARQATLNNKMRDEDRTERFNEEMSQKFDGLSALQLSRIDKLHSADLLPYKGPDGTLSSTDQKGKNKVVSLLYGNKDKRFQEAINAESPQQLLYMAAQGNAWAEKLAIMEEAQLTGQAEADVAAGVKRMKQLLSDPEIFVKVLENRKGVDPKAKAEQVKQFKMLKSSAVADPSKKTQLDATKFGMLLEMLQAEKTNTFVNDVRSWGATDPVLVASIGKIPQGAKPDVANVLTAFIGDAKDEERIQRINTFRKAIRNAAEKHNGSMFGVPDWSQAEAIAVEKIKELGFFRKTVDSFVNNQLGGLSAGPFGLGQLATGLLLQPLRPNQRKVDEVQ